MRDGAGGISTALPRPPSRAGSVWANESGSSPLLSQVEPHVREAISMDWAFLRSEFDGEPGSFLFEVRGNNWLPERFTQLEVAMRSACTEIEGTDSLDRWLVAGFWAMTDWLPAHTAHPNFRRPDPPSYYEAAMRRVSDLGYWFAHGQSLYRQEHVWLPVEPERFS